MWDAQHEVSSCMPSHCQDDHATQQSACKAMLQPLLHCCVFKLHKSLLVLLLPQPVQSTVTCSLHNDTQLLLAWTSACHEEKALNVIARRIDCLKVSSCQKWTASICPQPTGSYRAWFVHQRWYKPVLTPCSDWQEIDTCTLAKCVMHSAETWPALAQCIHDPCCPKQILSLW